jgi:hypothetical protein
MSLNGSDLGNEIIFISIIKKLKPISIYFETFHRSELVNKTLKIYFNRPDSFIFCFTFLLRLQRVLWSRLLKIVLWSRHGVLFLFL